MCSVAGIHCIQAEIYFGNPYWYMEWSSMVVQSIVVTVIISICCGFLIENLLICRYFDPLTIESPIRNKQQLHSRHLDSYFVYCSLEVVRA